MKNKLLIVTPYFYPEDFPINSFVDELVSKKEIVTVITGLPNYRKYGIYNNYSFLGPYVENIDNLKILRVPIIPRYSNSKISIFLFYASFFISSSIFLLFFSLFNRNKIKHIMAFCGSPVYVGILTNFFSKILNCKNSQWIQDIWPEGIETTVGLKSKKIVKMINLIQNLMWNNSDMLLAQSEDLKNYLLENTKCSNVQTLYNPVRSENNNKQLVVNENEKKQHINFSFMGTIGKGRSIHLLLEAFNELNHSDIILNVCGAGTELEKFQNLYKKNKKIIWNGWLDDNQLDTIANKTDFFIFGLENRDRQAFILPSKIQTYCMYSKPIICISDGASKSLIENFQIGLVSKSNKIEDIKNVINESINMDKNKKVDMSIKANKLYNNSFTKNAVAIKFLELIS